MNKYKKEVLINICCMFDSICNFYAGFHITVIFFLSLANKEFTYIINLSLANKEFTYIINVPINIFFIISILGIFFIPSKKYLEDLWKNT